QPPLPVSLSLSLSVCGVFIAAGCVCGSTDQTGGRWEYGFYGNHPNRPADAIGVT
ncbi:hypothetical protein M9458_005155, partial [Cirrhinus mrigala]